MKRIFTLGFLFLLSIAATTNLVWAGTPLKSATEDLPLPQFSSDDDSDEHWYYVQFNRRVNDDVVWSSSPDFPEHVYQLKKVDRDQRQHWKLVGDQSSFYFVNRQTGYKMIYETFTDPKVDQPRQDYLLDKEGTIAPARITLEKNTAQSAYGGHNDALAWVCINKQLGATAYMNDRNLNVNPWNYVGRSVCSYGTYDTGAAVKFMSADTRVISVLGDSLLIEAPVSNKGVATLSGVSAINLEENISAEISGDAASYFGFAEDNTIDKVGGSLKVTFTAPAATGIYRAVLTLSSPGANPVSIRLVGNAFDTAEMPLISSEDNSDEHWYYIQFYRKSAANTVWSLSDTTMMIIQDTLRATNIRDDQQWKICGDWENGYYIVNKTGIEMTYNTEASEGKPAGRYVTVSAGLGESFRFIRFGTTKDWQFYNPETSASSKYVNDQGGRHITNYSLNDAGNRLIFISADKPIISTTVASLTLETLTGTIEKPLLVSGLNLTAGITAALSGDDASVFGFGDGGSTLPATGGTLNITFTPVTKKIYKATLTLTSGTTTLTVPLTGDSDMGLPTISTPGNEAWYQIQFNRKPTLAWTAIPGTGGRYDTKVMQKTKTEGNTEQYWKFEGNETEGYRVINKNGGALAYDGITTGFIMLVEESAADRFLFKRSSSTAKWQLAVVDNYEVDEDGDIVDRLNDYQGVNGDGSISLYYADDEGGNALNFFAVGNTGINPPAFDANEKVVAVKYYTLMGQEIVRPTTSGIYIVRNTYVSGRVKASKQMFIFK